MVSFESLWRRVQHYTVGGDGQWLVMRLDRLLFVFSPLISLIFLLILIPSRLVQLFGASAVTKEYVLGVTDYSKATWGENFIASVAGAVASITVAAPLDTVKTRIQNANFERKVHGMTVVKDLIKNEGASAFFKGLTPKVSNLRFLGSSVDHANHHFFA